MSRTRKFEDFTDYEITILGKCIAQELSRCTTNELMSLSSTPDDYSDAINKLAEHITQEVNRRPEKRCYNCKHYAADTNNSGYCYAEDVDAWHVKYRHEEELCEYFDWKEGILNN